MTDGVRSPGRGDPRSTVPMPRVPGNARATVLARAPWSTRPAFAAGTPGYRQGPAMVDNFSAARHRNAAPRNSSVTALPGR